MTLVVYFKNGGTALFNQVNNFEVSEDTPNGALITFDYFGESTQVKRRAMFSLNSIAGFAKQID